MSEGDRRFEGDVAAAPRQKDELAPLWKVILHNDDYTTMEFVMEVLETLFHKSPAEAFRIMMLVHKSGFGVCGAYPYDIAETKVALVHQRAADRGYPLRATMEEA